MSAVFAPGLTGRGTVAHPPGMATFDRNGVLVVDDDGITIGERYSSKFGEMPPVMYWSGEIEGLNALMHDAIERGRKLTANDLMKAQGLTPPPPDAEV